MDFWEAFETGIDWSREKGDTLIASWNTHQHQQPKSAETGSIQESKNHQSTGLLSVASRANVRRNNIIENSVPKWTVVNPKSNQYKKIMTRPVTTTYEIDTVTSIANEPNEPSVENSSPANLICELLKYRPRNAVEVCEVAIHPEIRTFTGADDSYEDVRHKKHTCVTEPHELM